MNTIPHWPCPNNCLTWCRVDGSKTNHHPRCEFVDESLIDVWKVSLDGTSFYTDDKEEAEEILKNDPEVTITQERMHSEILENLPEFQGF